MKRRPMVAVFLGVATGVILATTLELQSVPAWSLGGLAASATFTLLVDRTDLTLKPVVILAATVLFGVILYGSTYFDPSTIQTGAGKIDQVEGRVTNYPKKSGNGLEFTIEPEGYEGKVKVFLSDSSGRAVDYGDTVTVSGNFQRPGRFQGFNYREYLRRKGVWLVTYRARVKSSENGNANPLLEFGWRVREALKSRVDRFLPRKGEFLIALLFGNRATLEEKVTDAFTGTGLAHLLAASGLHLGILVGVVWWVLTRFGLARGKIYLLSLPGLLLYLLIVGFKFPLLRASLIYVFGGAHFYLERSGLILSNWYDRYQALATAALLILLLEPGAINTAGFQLSFAATFAIALFIEPIENALDIKPDYLRGVLAASIAAQLGVGPVLAVHFDQIHPWAPVANLFAVPAVTLTLYLGLLTIALGGLQLLGFVIAKLTALLISLTEFVVRGLSQLPLAAVKTPPVTPLALISYFILLFWIRNKLVGNSPLKKNTGS